MDIAISFGQSKDPAITIPIESFTKAVSLILSGDTHAHMFALAWPKMRSNAT